MEPQLRGCGLNMIKLVRGVPSLEEEVVVCTKGEKLTAEKARLLSLLGVMMAVSARRSPTWMGTRSKTLLTIRQITPLRPSKYISVVDGQRQRVS